MFLAENWKSYSSCKHFVVNLTWRTQMFNPQLDRQLTALRCLSSYNHVSRLQMCSYIFIQGLVGNGFKFAKILNLQLIAKK